MLTHNRRTGTKVPGVVWKVIRKMYICILYIQSFPISCMWITIFITSYYTATAVILDRFSIVWTFLWIDFNFWSNRREIRPLIWRAKVIGSYRFAFSWNQSNYTIVNIMKIVTFSFPSLSHIKMAFNFFRPPPFNNVFSFTFFFHSLFFCLFFYLFLFSFSSLSFLFSFFTFFFLSLLFDFPSLFSSLWLSISFLSLSFLLFPFHLFRCYLFPFTFTFSFPSRPSILFLPLSFLSSSFLFPCYLFLPFFFLSFLSSSFLFPCYLFHFYLIFPFSSLLSLSSFLFPFYDSDLLCWWWGRCRSWSGGGRKNPATIGSWIKQVLSAYHHIFYYDKFKS